MGFEYENWYNNPFSLEAIELKKEVSKKVNKLKRKKTKTKYLKK